MTGLRALVEAVREARAKYDERRKFDSNGMASERWRLEVIMRERALATALLSTPDVLAAVEAVVALGEARVGQTAVRMNWRDGTEGHRERVAADQRAADARDDLFQLADRLAARKGE